MVKLLVNVLALVINKLYYHRPIPRFYVLETVARVPYFSYLSVLHLYETVGLWRRVDWLKVHFAESWNELHHLLIMESLGGNKYWIDRFLAQHVAVIYYWIIVGLYLVNPRAAYHFMELVEEHAYQTYDKFLTEQGNTLKNQPAPKVAIRYYTEGDLYLFDEFQAGQDLVLRRPKIENLYDVFVAIRDDEQEHIKTMVACQQADAHNSFKSPHTNEVELVFPSVEQEESASLVH